MRIVLFILSVLAVLIGVATVVLAQTVTHEILAGAFFVVAAILFIGAAIVDAIARLSERMNRAQGAAVKYVDPARREPEVNAAALDVLMQSGRFRKPPT